MAEAGAIPPAIRTFERMQIVALAVGWLNATYTYRTVLHDRVSPFVFAVALITVSVVVMVLVFLVSRRRSTYAKWLLIVLSALAVAPWAALLRRSGVADWAGVLSLFQAGLQIVSLFYLIHPASRAWFGSVEE
jgi:hypothetical protein